MEAILGDGERVIRFEDVGDLDRHGAMPLPPYMERPAEASDAERYQTVFARAPVAVAAPTAGLHFTPEILARVPHAGSSRSTSRSCPCPTRASSPTTARATCWSRA